MKKIFFTTFLASLLFVTGDVIASAQYYYPNQNYVYTNGYTYQNNINNCYYTNTYPPTYYGNCQNVTYTYPANNQVVYYTAPTYTYPQHYTTYYQNTPYTQRPVGQYYTYGYYNGSWYPGYSTNNLTNLFNNIFQNSNCSYRDGYQYCY